MRTRINQRWASPPTLLPFFFTSGGGACELHGLQSEGETWYECSGAVLAANNDPQTGVLAPPRLRLPHLSRFSKGARSTADSWRVFLRAPRSHEPLPPPRLFPT